jgi:hypothetical protein
MEKQGNFVVTEKADQERIHTIQLSRGIVKIFIQNEDESGDGLLEIEVNHHFKNGATDHGKVESSPLTHFELMWLV